MLKYASLSYNRQNFIYINFPSIKIHAGNVMLVQVGVVQSFFTQNIYFGKKHRVEEKNRNSNLSFYINFPWMTSATFPGLPGKVMS